MVICMERGAYFGMAQLMPLPLTVSCFIKIQIGFTFLEPAHPGSPGQGAVKWVCVHVCVEIGFIDTSQCHCCSSFWSRGADVCNTAVTVIWSHFFLGAVIINLLIIILISYNKSNLQHLACFSY